MSNFLCLHPLTGPTTKSRPSSSFDGGGAGTCRRLSGGTGSGTLKSHIDDLTETRVPTSVWRRVDRVNVECLPSQPCGDVVEVTPVVEGGDGDPVVSSKVSDTGLRHVVGTGRDSVSETPSLVVPVPSVGGTSVYRPGRPRVGLTSRSLSDFLRSLLIPSIIPILSHPTIRTGSEVTQQDTGTCRSHGGGVGPRGLSRRVTGESEGPGPRPDREPGRPSPVLPVLM